MKIWLFIKKATKPATRKQATRMVAVMGIGMLLLGLLSIGSLPAGADEPASPPAEPIRITADRLTSDSAQRTAVFSGNVKAVQAQTTILADQLTLTYKAGGSGGQEGMDAESIETIEAKGHVRITFDNRVAVSEKAVYTTIDKKLVLSGPGSSITSDKDVITGSRITFYREQGRFEIVGDESGQVKATIHSDQSGLN
jgi:lipopolysaccharide export system protein LptA